MLVLRALLVFHTLFFLASNTLRADPAPDIEDQTRAISTELRCVVCQNLSVADSPSEMAQQMRAIVREQLKTGKTPEEIKSFFVSKYGEWVLLKPKTTGIAALLWILPYVALVLGVLAALWFLRRWALAHKAQQPTAAPTAACEAAARQFLNEDFAPPELEDASPGAGVLRELGRLKAELVELDFDFQSGKFSDTDHAALKREIESKAAGLMQQLHALPAQKFAKPAANKQITQKPGRNTDVTRARLRRWQLITGGLFLLLFGLALGVMLTQSLRPRQNENDSMTGDFMTGTKPANSDASAILAQGKQAFSRQDFPKAIEAFKKVLATEPDNPEAHAYMGMILLQAGHGEGALMAFEKALSGAPNFPMALWGKGMVLYHEQKNFAGARIIFERLLSMLPPGEDRDQIAKVLAEIPSTGGAPTPASTAPPVTSSSDQTISGRITVDSRLNGNVDPQAVLFIIARSAAHTGGPPLAVKKIEKPSFPLNYSLSQENVMMQSRPFSGKINITVRLDIDGNPTTRGPGDLTGEYKENPAEAGAQNVDISIDQVMH